MPEIFTSPRALTNRLAVLGSRLDGWTGPPYVPRYPGGTGMASTPPLIDYTKLTPLKLRDLRGRYEAQGYPHLALDCTKELLRRGAARSADYSNLQWNQDKVRALFVPFRALAAFEGNERTSYTEAGGSRIGARGLSEALTAPPRHRSRVLSRHRMPALDSFRTGA